MEWKRGLFCWRYSAGLVTRMMRSWVGAGNADTIYLKAPQVPSYLADLSTDRGARSPSATLTCQIKLDRSLTRRLRERRRVAVGYLGQATARKPRRHLPPESSRQIGELTVLLTSMHLHPEATRNGTWCTYMLRQSMCTHHRWVLCGFFLPHVC